MGATYTLGIDVGGTNLRFGLVDRSGALIGFEKQSVRCLSENDPAASLAALADEYLLRHGAKEATAAVCIGFPATVDKRRERVLNAPNVKGFDGVPVGRIVEEALGLPTCIERDVNLLLLSDCHRLGLTDADIVACYIGTGVGNAIMLGGQLFCGHNGVAGELGHIPYGDSDELCGCGNVGCAESLVGGLALTRLTETQYQDTPIAELFLRHGDEAPLRRYVERLSRVIAAEINLLDPEYLLLGGGVIEMPAFPKQALEAAILLHTRKPLPHDHLKILYADADGQNGVRGAGLYAWRKL